MKNHTITVFKALIFVTFLAFFVQNVSSADPVVRLSYQGRLTNSNGVPVADGNYDITFKIYDSLSGGTLLWTEIHNGANQVAVSDGLFSTILGAITALPDFSGAAYYIETTVGATVYSPRQQVAGAATSINADRLDNLHAGNASGNVPINNGTVNTNLNADMVDGKHIGSGGGLDADTVDTFHANQNRADANVIVVRDASGVTAVGAINMTGQLTNSVANGTTPMNITSQTVVANLNADLHDGYHAGNASGNVPVSNGTVNTNLNADMADGFHANQNRSDANVIVVRDASGVVAVGAINMTGQLTNSVANGTTPMNITSQTAVANLNADLHDGYHAGNANGNVPVSNGTVNTNLNADMVDGKHIGSGNGLDADTVDTFHANQNRADANVIVVRDASGVTAVGAINMTGQLTNSVANGTTPMNITSQTAVANLNADLHDGYHAGNANGNIPVSNGTVNTNLNADLLDGYNSPQLGNFGNWEPHGTYTDCNTNPNYWGWNYVQGNTNCPNTTSSQWYRGDFGLGSNYPMRGAGSYSLELAIPRYSVGTAGVWVRTVEGGAIGGWSRIDGSDPNAGAWTLSGNSLYPDSTAYNVGIGNAGPAVKLHVTGNTFIDTGGNSAVERNVTIKNSGQGQINFGSYPGSWTPALQLQNNDNTHVIWISPQDNGLNARIRTGGSGLEFYVGGATTDTGTLAGSFDTGGTFFMGGNQSIDAGSGWHRSYGNTGWLNGTYGGGWYMADSTWIRSYGSKQVYVDSMMRADGGFRVYSSGASPGATEYGTCDKISFTQSCAATYGFSNNRCPDNYVIVSWSRGGNNNGNVMDNDSTCSTTGYIYCCYSLWR